MVKMKDTHFDIAIIGAGASGVLSAVSLLQDSGISARIVLISSSEEIGAGLAYKTKDERHLLNVPAKGMSGLACVPEDFQNFSKVEPNNFLPRSYYFKYLNNLLENSRVTSTSKLFIIKDIVKKINRFGDDLQINLSDDYNINAKILILATGYGLFNENLENEKETRLVSAWKGILPMNRLKNSSIAVLGSGLSAVDYIVTILDNNLTHKITVISTHGLFPRPHTEPLSVPYAAPIYKDPLLECSKMLRLIKQAGTEWRSALDSVRSKTNELWISLDFSQQKMFFSRLARYWDIHRHRMAPEVAEKISIWFSEGKIDLVQAHVNEIKIVNDSVIVEIDKQKSLEFDFVVDARNNLVSPITNPALKNLIQSGEICLNIHGKGLEVEPNTGRAINKFGEIQDQIFTIGPVRFGTLLETTAIPEIRLQAKSISDQIRIDLKN